MQLLEDKNRDYQRYRHSPRERNFLGLQGLQPVLSSNVSAVGIKDTSLLIRFHNGSVYEYFNKADQYDNLLKSNSKGKWVWRFLRRRFAPFQKLGIIPLPDDIGVTDEDIFQEIDNRYLADLTRHVDVPVFQSFEFIKGVNMQKIMVGNLTAYKPILNPLPVKPKDVIGVQGKNIINTLDNDIDIALKEVREMNDLNVIIKKQGYDGNPQLVNKDTFEKNKKQTNIVIVRGYKAKSRELGDQYRKEMESGEFYIDNSGGAVYGRGMYFAYADADDDRQIKDAQKVAKNYAGGTFGNIPPNGTVDIATFDETARIATDIEIENELIENLKEKYLNDNDRVHLSKTFEIEKKIQNLNTQKQQDLAKEKDLDKQKAIINKYLKKVEQLRKDLRNTNVVGEIPKDVSEKYQKIKEAAGSMDKGVAATMLGYDGYKVTATKNYFVVVNRTKLVMLDNGGNKDDLYSELDI